MIFIGVPMKKGTIRHLAEHIMVEMILEKFPEAKPYVRQYKEPLDKFWPAVDGDKVQPVYEETGLLKKSTLGDATIMCASCTPFVDEMIDMCIKDPHSYMGYTAFLEDIYVEWIKNCR